MNKRDKIFNLITFIIIVVFFGFGFQYLFTTEAPAFESLPNSLLPALIPIIFTEIWWDAIKNIERNS